MSTPFDAIGIVAPTGSKNVAALHLPIGLTTGASSTIVGGVFTGTQSIPSGASAVYLSLSEIPAGSGIFYGESLVSGTALPDATTRPYTIEVRTVASVGTDLTSYSSCAAAFAASSTVAYARDVLGTILTGMLRGGAWNSQDNDVVSIKAKTDNLPSTVILCDADGRFIVDAHKVKFTIVGDTQSVYRADNTTVSYAKTLTTDVAALPITGN